ncbi:uncharacterized protein LOC103179887 [Callorhinchus milii]|uniref:uncharacterized protein LOC103179887 n=1 Tax=Callorhinchus milii TaxID=7868 RepID=UPI001C3F4E62|nr:uncharacterized protein LOC103179887 [Callorhinchus milii]
MYAMDLEHLLARFNLKRRDGLVDYLKFVEKLQSRSNLSLFNKMLPKLNHRLYADGENPRVYKDGLTASEAEVCLLKQCHRLFLQLLTAFRKADISDHETVSYHEFKEILEKVFQIQLTKDQLDTIVNKAGYLENNLVDYPKFLLLFQDRPSTCELKEEVARFSLRLKDQNIRVDRIRYIERFGGDLARYSHAQKQRPLQELRTIVHNLLQRKLRSFCKVFVNVCKNDACTADKEKLDSVLLRMNIILLPMELEKLWHSLPISYPVEAISLRKLLRHFSRCKNVRESGGKYLQESPVFLTLNKLRRDIVDHWNDLKSVLKERDPCGTGKVPFRDVQALCITLKLNVLPTEIHKLCQAFDQNKNGEFHYIPFLKFYVKKKQGKSLT